MSKKLYGIIKGKHILENANIVKTEVKASQHREGRVLYGTKAVILRTVLSIKLQRNAK